MMTKTLITGFFIFLLPTNAVCAEQAIEETRIEDVRFLWIPGPARAIPFFLSASRDVGAVSIQLSPYLSSKAGGDLALFALEGQSATLRFGYFGLMEAEGSDPLEPGADGFWGIFPAEAVILWRGQYGASLSLALTGLAQRWFGPSGGLEMTLSFRHESEHYFGEPGEDGSRWEGVKDIGNFFMLDTAFRVPIEHLIVELKGQFKGFLPSHGGFSYTVGPGADAAVLWQLHEKALPFFSTFFEYLVGGDRVSYRDNYLVRALLGAVFPGRAADLQLYLSTSMGHGKGLLAFEEEFLFGGGLRISWPHVYEATNPRIR